MNRSKAAFSVVLMAKPAVPGNVKTRLMTRFSARQAASVHQAMLDCLMGRLVRILPGTTSMPLEFILAVDGGVKAWGDRPLPASWRLVDQFQGDLGTRLDRVWEDVGGGGALFFGVDSPDVPATLLGQIFQRLQEVEATAGPVADGGYWMLGARRRYSVLLKKIDWGTSSVYHQTLQAARAAKMTFAPVDRWYDVDLPEDVCALYKRLGQTQDPDLLMLKRQLKNICKDDLE